MIYLKKADYANTTVHCRIGFFNRRSSRLYSCIGMPHSPLNSISHHVFSIVRLFMQ